MNNSLKKLALNLFRKFGLDIVPYHGENNIILPPDIIRENKHIIRTVKKYTMTSPERINAVIEAAKYIVVNNIEGSFVECGVWKGGSTMAMALSLMESGITDRDLYLYDTYAGMSMPTNSDVSFNGTNARRIFKKTKISKESSKWCLATIEEVKRNIISTTYPKEKLHFIKGKVEDTIPKTLPDKIALLRLDTDWYESTRHELTYLFPRLSEKGVLIIDDYGHWQGAQKAVDEYIHNNRLCIFLNRIDYTGRIGIKVNR